MPHPFRIAVLGDFGARGAGAGSWTPARVDRDDDGEHLARIAPELTLETPEGELELCFRELEDFEPDALYARLPLFEELRTLKRRLADPAQARAAVAEHLRDPAPEPRRRKEREGDLLGAVLEATAPGESERDLAREAERTLAAGGTGHDLARKLAREIVAPFATPGADPRAADLSAAVDDAIEWKLREILLHPSVRALETTWRGLRFLVRRLETSSALQVSFVDVSKEALASDPSRLRRSLGALGEGLWIGAYTFDATARDAELLAEVAHAAAGARALFAGAAAPALAGCPSFAAAPDQEDWTRKMEREASKAWARLREQDSARHVALLAPRFLVRMPYGRRGTPAENVRLEELGDAVGPERHERLPWANAAWLAPFAGGLEVSNLPFYADDGAADGADDGADGDEPVAVPCAEVCLSDAGAERLRAAGITPVRSLRGRPSVLVPPLRSLARDGALGA